MNALDTSALADAENAEAQAPRQRVIRKYPNRRLYDTVQSRYITLADVRELVLSEIDFVVIDKKSQDDITRCILLQVICEQEQVSPMLSHDFLTQVIACHGGGMQGVVGSYLEQSLKLLSLQQPHLRQQMHQMLSDEACQHIATLTEQNLDRWREVQSQIFQAMTQPRAQGHTSGG